MLFRVVILLLFLLAPSGVVAKNPCSSSTVKRGIVESSSGGSFSLRGDPQKFQIAGIDTMDQSNLLPIATNVAVHILDSDEDRYGRQSAQVYRDDGTWVQGEAVAQGLALLSGHPLNAACLKALRKKEQEARVEKRGIWGGNDVLFKADSPTSMLERAGEFAVVEGRVLSIGDRSRQLYLNFGKNWSDDFTVSVVKTGRGAFKGDKSMLTQLKGKSVRVRGILEIRQGPLIRLFYDSQIEILE